MEIRKLIQSGQSSLVMALPQRWVQANNLKKGDQIYVDCSENKLVISPFTKKSEESKFIIEKNRDTERFLDNLLYAGFLSDKKYIVVENIDDAGFYEILRLLKKFHYLKLDERSKNSVRLSFVADPEGVDIEKEIIKLSNFFDLFLGIFTGKTRKKADLEEAYDQISSQLLFCMKIMKLKFLDYNKNSILRMKQQLDSYYFLLVNCKNLILNFKICLGDRKISNLIEKVRVMLENLKALISEGNLLGIMRFWEANEDDKKKLLDIIYAEKNIKKIQVYFLIYNSFTNLENIAYSYVNNH